MRYPRRLAGLEMSLSLIRTTSTRLVLLTGQSSFRSSRLSAAQLDFLEAVAPEGVEPLKIGFPYHSYFDVDEPPPGLVASSLRNALQFYWSLFSPVYQLSIGHIFQALIQNTSENLYIVTGSCGLQMLESAWSKLNIPHSLNIRVVALGPAQLCSGGLPLHNTRILQGRRDVWSRLLYRGKADELSSGGHMDYWRSPEVRGIVARWLRDWEKSL